MAWVAYHKWKQGQMDAASQPSAPVDFNTDDIRLLLLTSGATPTVATDEDVADAIASSGEVTGSEYARKALAGEAITLSSGTVTFDASDPAAYSQSASGFSDARYAVLYKHNASDASAALVAYYDLGANKGNKTGSLTLQFSAAGVFTFA